MKSLLLGLACTLLLAVDAGADSPPLTYEKIRFIADNCGSATGFSEWLKTRKEVKQVATHSIILTSHPPKTDVLFELNGKPYRIRVSPDLSFRKLEVAYEQARNNKVNNPGEEAGEESGIQREIAILNRMLKAYEAQPQTVRPVK